MSKLNVELCPETGICSIIKEDGSKVDMIAHEVDQLRQAAGNSEKVKAVLGQVDPSFSDGLSADELEQLSSQIS